MNRRCKIAVLGMIVSAATSAAAQSPAFPAAAYNASGHTLSFDGKKSSFQVTSDKDKSVLVEGIYTVSNDKVSLTDQSGPYACPGDLAKGSYQWAVTDEGLKLTKLEDPCDPRSSELTAQVWRKK